MVPASVVCPTLQKLFHSKLNLDVINTHGFCRRDGIWVHVYVYDGNLERSPCALAVVMTVRLADPSLV